MYSTKYRSWHQLCLLTNHENPRHGQKSIVTSSGLNRFAKIDSNIRTDITEKLPDVRMQPQIEEANRAVFRAHAHAHTHANF